MGCTTWDNYFRTTPLSQKHTFWSQVRLPFLWQYEFRHVPLWSKSKGSIRTGLYFRQSEAYSSLPCCVSFLFTSSQSLALNQNHLLCSSRHLQFPGSFLIHQVLHPLQSPPKSETSYTFLGMQFSGTVLCLECVKLWAWYLAPRIEGAGKRKKKINHQNHNKNLTSIMAVCACNPSTQQAEAGPLWVGRLASNSLW